MTHRHLERPCCRRPTRREFLATAGAATLGALAAGNPRAVWAQSPERITPTADTLIVLWMGGGMAHTETFDPKRYTPFERGLRPEQVLSTFPSIDTAVDGIRFSQGLEGLAGVMDRGTLIRSYTAGDLGSTRAINTSGTPATRPRRRLRLPTSAPLSPVRLARATRPCPRSSTSGSASTSARVRS